MTKQQLVSKFNWKNCITTSIAICSLITAILVIDSRYASSEDLKKTEMQLVATLEQFKQEQEDNPIICPKCHTQIQRGKEL